LSSNKSCKNNVIKYIYIDDLISLLCRFVKKCVEELQHIPYDSHFYLEFISFFLNWLIHLSIDVNIIDTFLEILNLELELHLQKGRKNKPSKGDYENEQKVIYNLKSLSVVLWLNKLYLKVVLKSFLLTLLSLDHRSCYSFQLWNQSRGRGFI
jgi:hypothetical protein